MEYVNSKSGFEQLLSENRVVVVFYIGEQCPNCYAMAEAREQLAASDSDVAFITVDTTVNRKLAMSNRVLGIPTTQFYKRGNLVESIHGISGIGSLKEALEKTKTTTVR